MPLSVLSHRMVILVRPGNHETENKDVTSSASLDKRSSGICPLRDFDTGWVAKFPVEFEILYH